MINLKFGILSKRYLLGRKIVLYFLLLFFIIGFILEKIKFTTFFTELLKNYFLSIPLIIFLVYFLAPSIRKPKLKGYISFNQDSFSIIGIYNKIIPFPDIKHIKIYYSSYFNEFVIQSSKIRFDTGVNNIILKTEKETFKYDFFSSDYDDADLIRKYLQILEANRVSYFANIKGIKYGTIGTVPQGAK